MPTDLGSNWSFIIKQTAIRSKQPPLKKKNNHKFLSQEYKTQTEYERKRRNDENIQDSPSGIPNFMREAALKESGFYSRIPNFGVWTAIILSRHFQWVVQIGFCTLVCKQQIVR